MDLTKTTIAVVGATGAVGLEMLSILHGMGVPAGNVRALASARSAGKQLAYGDGTASVSTVNATAFEGAGVALLAASSDAAREWAPFALEAGADVVDNSSAFRMDPQIPLVVPEVNADAIPARADRASDPARLIANPNCSTIIMLMAVTPLYRAFGVERLVVNTYQAVSGAGAAAMEELVNQAKTVLEGGTPTPEVFGEVCAFNVFSHDSAIDPATGRNTEEEKLIRETKKIWADDAVRVTGTCMRVPVLRAHTEAINVTLGRPATEAEVREAIAGGAGVEILDDRAANTFPTPLKSSGKDDVLVGRIRPDAGEELDADGRCLRFDLICSGDQLRKGAALNAIQIAQRL